MTFLNTPIDQIMTWDDDFIGEGIFVKIPESDEYRHIDQTRLGER